jgi:antitoxin CcdA
MNPLERTVLCAHTLRIEFEEYNMARGMALRKPTNVSARTDLVSEAKALDINLSEVFELALENAVRDAQRERWVEENRQAFSEYDRFVETNGVFSDGKRLF